MGILDFLTPAGPVYKGAGQEILKPTAAVTTPKAFTLTFPNGIAAIPKRVRVSGSVAGSIALQYGAGEKIIIPINPNAPYTQGKIPPGSFKTPTTTVNMEYTASGAGTIIVIVDY